MHIYFFFQLHCTKTGIVCQGNCTKKISQAILQTDLDSNNYHEMTSPGSKYSNLSSAVVTHHSQ